MNHTPNSPSALKQKTKRDLATLLWQQGNIACLVVLVTSTAAAFVATDRQPSGTVLIWWLLALAVVVYRLIDISYWKKYTAGTDFDGSKQIWRFAIPSLVSAGLLGFFPFIAFADIEFLGRALVVLILSGLAGGATTVLAADRGLALIYVSLLLVPPSGLTIIWSEYNMQPLGLLGLIYWFILVLAIRRNASFIHKAAKLHHYNEELLGVIAEEKRLVEYANEKLQDAYAEINSVNEVLEQKIHDRTQALSILASTDDLTGLKNRHTFVDSLNTTITNAEKNNQRFSLFFVDLDGFKEINDIRGHLIGDEVLQTIADRLQLSVKNRDFLCRWGGDEFVLVIEESVPLVLDTISARICQSVQQPISIEFDNIKVTTSIGIATYPIHGKTSTELVNAADIAMYELKKTGKNGAMIFEPAFLEKIRFEQHLLTGLSKAVANQELDLHYQPMAPCRNNDPIIFEGLIRWKFEGAYVPPVIFVPIAESCDAIHDLGNWIIRRACRDLHENQLGINSRISINISVRQLLSRYFVEFIRSCLEEYQLQSWRLQIEITESVFANNLRQANIVLSQLRELGIVIALDDFGCGFSSLSYLQALPIDTIKIDQSFVRQIDSGGEKIIEATVSIAEAFGCKVVAEGIESEQQKARLQELRVDYLQGFHIAKPCRPEEMHACWLINEHKRRSF